MCVCVSCFNILWRYTSDWATVRRFRSAKSIFNVTDSTIDNIMWTLSLFFLLHFSTINQDPCDAKMLHIKLGICVIVGILLRSLNRVMLWFMLHIFPPPFFFLPLYFFHSMQILVPRLLIIGLLAIDSGRVVFRPESGSECIGRNVLDSWTIFSQQSPATHQTATRCEQISI